MTITAFIATVRGKLREFRQARTGNVAIIFGLSAIPLVGLMGVAIDYSRANSARAAMQAALDATGLTLSKEAQSLSKAQLDEKAFKYFLANFNRPDVTDIKITPTFTDLNDGRYQLRVAGTAKVPVTILDVLPGAPSKMDIGTDTEVIWGYKKLELALALDNTGSMASSNKMGELKKAVTSLLDTLKKAAKKPDDIKIAIIPFDTGVRVDQTYNSRAEWVTFDYYGNNNEESWKGCIMDRDQSNDVSDTPPEVGKPKTLYPAVPCTGTGSLAKILPLTNDWNALQARVDQMTPNGNTNVTIGLTWAWHALTTNLPLKEASAPKTDLDKVIILLTDGENTRNRWTGNQSQIDNRTKTACTNVKAAGIKLYTIRVIDGNASLLRNCATETSMYYDVQSASQLNMVFTTIANSLASLRLSQ